MNNKIQLPATISIANTIFDLMEFITKSNKILIKNKENTLQIPIPDSLSKEIKYKILKHQLSLIAVLYSLINNKTDITLDIMKNNINIDLESMVITDIILALKNNKFNEYYEVYKSMKCEYIEQYTKIGNHCSYFNSCSIITRLQSKNQFAHKFITAIIEDTKMANLIQENFNKMANEQIDEITKKAKDNIIENLTWTRMYHNHDQ